MLDNSDLSFLKTLLQKTRETQTIIKSKNTHLDFLFIKNMIQTFK
jgi:hypothetical protein